MLRGFYFGGFRALRFLPATPLLRVQSGRCGFFGDLFTALNGIRFAQLNHLRVQLDWNQSSLYYEAERGCNVWSYYFKECSFDFSSRPPSRLSLPYRPGAADFVPYAGMSIRSSVGVAIEQFCKPRANVLRVVDDFTNRHFSGRPVLGVHVRQTDAASGFENRISVSADAFLEAAASWISVNPSGLVFLATDDERVVDNFKRRLGNIILYRDCIRSVDERSLHGHYDAAVAGSPYEKGLDVIVDALLLSRCNYLIRSHSRVTCYSLCVSANLEFSDLDLKNGPLRTPWLHSHNPLLQ